MTNRSQRVVYHDRFVALHKKIRSARAQAIAGAPQILPLIGPTRVGKTHLLSEFRSQARNPVREIVHVESPKQWTGRALPDACLKSIGMNPFLFKNQLDATKAFVQALGKLKCRLVIFDETQHLLERGGSTSIRAAGDYVKQLYDDAQISIVLAGLPSLEGLLHANEQLADRCLPAAEFYPYHWDDGDELKSFAGAVASYLEELQEAGWQAPCYRDADFVYRMYAASGGRIGMVSRLFDAVLRQANEAEVADNAVFAQAFAACINRALVGFNPFDTAREVAPEHLGKAYSTVMGEAHLLARRLAC